MSLSLCRCHQQPPFTPKTLTDPLLPPFFHPSTVKPRTRTFHFSRPPKFLLCSSAPDAQTITKSAIQRIADKLLSLGYLVEDGNSVKTLDSEPGQSSVGEIFVPPPNQLSKYRVGLTLDPSWSTPENPVPSPGSGTAITRFNELRSEVHKQRQLGKKDEEQRVPTLAELTLPMEELKRLRGLGIGLKKKLKVGKAGITEGIVNGIHERWRRYEVVKIACEDFCKMNMKRTHDLLERKTGGLVVWRSGSKIILYRGAKYKYPYFFSDDSSTNDTLNDTVPSPTNQNTKTSLVKGVGTPNRVRFQLPGEVQFAEEADGLLDGLGPRFTDWWGYDPLPVDADLLPAVVHGYRKPFRLLPYGMKPKLTDDEMTILRRLGRPLPCHFAVGRNKNLQGLASAIVKLWEKCEIAKIAVKRGVQNTNSEMMAEELKRLTGGTLLSRDKEFIVFYRGKDFLPAAVSSAIEERRRHVVLTNKQRTDSTSSIMTEQQSKCVSKDEPELLNDQTRNSFSKEKKLSATETAIERTSMKLSMALQKKEKAVRLLEELEKVESLQQPEVDKEGITEEERYMLRKVGLRMKPFLLLGRRGVFDGTVENMHLHWKYRELVKIICGNRSIEAVHSIARTLESESGGILVAVERVSKGYAIIVYRGKNYRRPSCLRPRTLLNKREAMKRSLEAQRRESLKLHVLKLTRNIDELKLKLDEDKETKNVHAKKDTNGVQSDQFKITDTELRDGYCSSSAVRTCDQAHAKIKGNVVERTFANSSDSSCSSVGSSQTIQHNNIIEFSPICEDQTGNIDEQVSSESLQNHISQDEKLESATNKLRPLDHKVVKSESTGMPLSNRDRLLLRKQALKMKKRPVLAVGRSNIVTGVAKAIKAHLQKHPLAIVNVKGRAKGTSVQELVSKLEKATGAVLVSQEPSKVILYRGWGAAEEHSLTNNNLREISESREQHVPASAVSSELMEAMRLECGMQCSKEEATTL